MRSSVIIAILILAIIPAVFADITVSPDRIRVMMRGINYHANSVYDLNGLCIYYVNNLDHFLDNRLKYDSICSDRVLIRANTKYIVIYNPTNHPVSVPYNTVRIDSNVKYILMAFAVIYNVSILILLCYCHYDDDEKKNN